MEPPVSLENMVAWFLKEGHVFLPIRMQFGDGRIAFLAEPNKGAPLEHEAVEFIEGIHQWAVRTNTPHETMQRNFLSSQRIDCVVLYFGTPRDGCFSCLTAAWRA